MKAFRTSDPGSTLIIVLSFGLFFLALFLKGFTRELLLEAGVLLVSVKLIRMARKNTETSNRVEAHLMHIEALLAPATSQSDKPESQHS
jgi:hypothetical protein